MDKHLRSVQGVILAGGQSWGGPPSEVAYSRPLLPLLGRPVVWYVVEWFRRSGITQIITCGDGNTEALRSHLGDGRSRDLNLVYCRDAVPRGTAGCIRDAVVNTGADEIVAVDATFLTDMDLFRLLSVHRAEGASFTVIAGKNPASPGPNHLQPAGVYIISRAALEHVSAHAYQDIKEMWIPKLYRAGLKVVCHQVDLKSYVRVLNGRSYLSAVAWAIRQIQREPIIEPGYRRMGESFVYSTARLDSTVRLVGPCVIGPRCRLKHSATIIGPAVVGADCVVQAAAVVNQSAIWQGVQIGTGAVVDRSIVASGAVVAPGMFLRESVWGERALNGRAAEMYWRLGVEPTKAETRMSGSGFLTRTPFLQPITASAADSGLRAEY